jgi:hypothetical protein
VIEDGEGQRILSGAIVERFARNGDGELVPWIEGSKIAETRTHAGICKTARYTFALEVRDEFDRTIR